MIKTFNDFKSEEEKEQNIQLGNICKYCYEIIPEDKKCNKPTFCKGCENSMSNSYSGK